VSLTDKEPWTTIHGHGTWGAISARLYATR
jgi:hypothetical protein